MNSNEVLTINNLEKVTDEITNFIKNQTVKLRKNGIVVGISGGVDSALTATLAVRALGSENVLGLIMPEKESSKDSKKFAELLIKKLGIKSEVLDITQKLESFNVYEIRENIVKKRFPNYNSNCQYRVTIPKNLLKEEKAILPMLEVLEKNKKSSKIKISYNDYLTLTAATSVKHRVRMTLEYYYAEKLNYLVIGSTNKSELMQGYFVKYGDGGVDLEPLGDLFKTQVYQIAKSLEIPDEIINRNASPDTWSYQVSDEEFFFGIPYEVMDLIWRAKEKKIPISEISKISKLDESQINNILNHLERKSTNTEHMRKMPPMWKFNELE